MGHATYKRRVILPGNPPLRRLNLQEPESLAPKPLEHARTMRTCWLATEHKLRGNRTKQNVLKAPPARCIYTLLAAWHRATTRLSGPSLPRGKRPEWAPAGDRERGIPRSGSPGSWSPAVAPMWESPHLGSNTVSIVTEQPGVARLSLWDPVTQVGDPGSQESSSWSLEAPPVRGCGFESL